MMVALRCIGSFQALNLALAQGIPFWRRRTCAMVAQTLAGGGYGPAV